MITAFEMLDSWWHVLIPLLFTLAEILGIFTAWHAAQRVRTAQAAVAWAVALVTLPIVFLPLYWIFGKNRFEGYRDAIREVGVEHKGSVEAVRRELLTETNQPGFKDCSLGRLADILDTPPSEGNEFNLLIDGDDFFDALIDHISSAQEYVYAQFYIIRDDEIGNRFADALCERAKAGKTVRLLYDEVGCLGLSSDYLKRLRVAGVEARAFNTRQGWTNRFQINFRNHRKLLVVDGKRTIVGGFNIGDEYAGKLSWASHWRDTAIAAAGPVARKVQAVFAADYYWATRRDLPEAHWGTPNEEDEDTDNSGEKQLCPPKGLAAVCATGPADEFSRATMMFAAAAAEAEERLWISTPYLVPDEISINALTMARARGVDVRLLIPEKADHWLVKLAGYYYEEMFEALGISVCRYPGGFLHQKCLLVDDDLALIGSTNLDNRSLYLNFELMLAVAEPKMVEQVAEMLERDFSEVSAESRSSARLLSWYVRIGTVIARLFSPVL